MAGWPPGEKLCIWADRRDVAYYKRLGYSIKNVGSLRRPHAILMRSLVMMEISRDDLDHRVRQGDQEFAELMGWG